MIDMLEALVKAHETARERAYEYYRVIKIA